MMQPKPPIQKRESITNTQNKFTTRRKEGGGTQPSFPPHTTFGTPAFRTPIFVSKPAPIPPLVQKPIFVPAPEPEPVLVKPRLIKSDEPVLYHPEIQTAKEPKPKQSIYNQHKLNQPVINYTQTQPRPVYRQPLLPAPNGMRYNEPNGNQLYEETGGNQEFTPEEIEQQLANDDQNEQRGRTHEEDEREFVGGKKLYDRQLMQQPMYDEPTMQILNDIASDESFPILVQYITQLSHLGRQAQARLIARAAAFQSKNQVFSNINNLNDYMMAQDDFTYAQILSKADYSTYDMNADYFTAEAIMEAQFNIRLRRSRNALNLLQINTQRQESIMGQHPQQEEERKLSRKIPFLGQYMG